MGDSRDKPGVLGRLGFRESRVEPLRERMRTFVVEHDEPDDLPSVRERTRTGVKLSALVDEERDGRLN